MPSIRIAAAALAATLSFAALPLVSAGESGTAPALTALPDAVAPRTAPTAEIDLCGQRDAMVADLGEQFQEMPLASGLVDKNAVVEIFVSPAGTWTILATGTDGQSCVMAVGEGFEANSPVRGVGA